MIRAPMASGVARVRSNLPFAVLAAAVAAVVGVLAAVSPSIAVGAVVALVAIPAAVLRPKIVLYILVVTVFTQAITFGGVTVSRLAAPIGFLALLSELVSRPAGLVRARGTLGFVAGYAAVAVASMAWTVSPSGTATALASLAISLVYMGCFAVLLRDHRDAQRLMWLIAAAALILALFWLAEFVSGADRRFNAAGDPNFTAAFLVLSLPVVIAAASSSRGWRRMAVYGVVTVIAAAVLATLSRGGIGALLATLLLLVVLPVRSLHSTPAQKLGLVLSVAVGLAVLLPVAGPQLLERFDQGSQQTSLVGERMDLWRAAVHGYRQHPLSGIGYGGFDATSFQLLRQTPGVNLAEHIRFLTGGEVVHNSYLETLTELGPLGLLLFLGVLWSTARSLLRTARRARAAGDPLIRALANAFLVALIAYSLSSILLSTEQSRALWMLVGISLALPGILARRIGPQDGVEASRKSGPDRPEVPQGLDRHGATIRTNADL